MTERKLYTCDICKTDYASKEKAILSRPVCSQCEFYDFNEMSDEAYCVAKDYEPIRIYRKHRPDWCPRLNK